MEWVLAMFIAGSREPVIIATGYQTAEQCEMAGNLMKAADQAVKKIEQPYSMTCTEQTAPGQGTGGSSRIP